MRAARSARRSTSGAARGRCGAACDIGAVETAPDLVVSEITHTPSIPGTGQTVAITVTATNQGDGPAPRSYIDIYPHLESPPGQVFGSVYCGEFLNIAPGASVICSTANQIGGPITYSTPGDYSLWARVDVDGFTAESDELNNVGGPHPITVDDLPNADSDGDGFTNKAESGIPLCNGVNNDGFDDTVVDDGCPGGPNMAGTYSEGQFKIGTGSLDPCGSNGWPLDLVSTGISVNEVDIVDLASFVSGVRKLDKNPNEAGFDSRWDVVPGRTFGKFINTADLAAFVGGVTGFPPMLSGARAFNGPPCPPTP